VNAKFERTNQFIENLQFRIVAKSKFRKSMGLLFTTFTILGEYKQTKNMGAYVEP
jgi:hypothetical protein